MKARLGKLISVENKEKKKFSNAASGYVAVLVKGQDGKVVTLLFTENEIAKGYYRAETNPEDCLEQSFLSKLID